MQRYARSSARFNRDIVECKALAFLFFQNIDDEESRRIYGVASILSIGILVSLVNYIWGDRIAEWIPGGIERTEQIFWTLWYLFMIAMMMVGTIRCVRRQRQKKEKKYKNLICFFDHRCHNFFIY